MPKIRMLTTACGPEFSFSEGGEYEVTGEVARALVSAGAATWALQPVEEAVEAPTETREEPASPVKRRRGR